jgi:hypothetical protein
MWLDGSGFRKLYAYRCRVSLFLVDETAVMVVWMACKTLQQQDDPLTAALMD